MTKHTIEIEGLPKGWEPVDVTCQGDLEENDGKGFISAIIELRRKREITLVETEQDNIKHDGKWCNQHFRDGLILTKQPKY